MPRTIADATARGAYSTVVEAGGFVFLSGQGGIVPESGVVVGPGIVEQTEQTVANIAELLGEAGLTLEDLVQVTCYLTDMDDWAEMDRVYSRAMNGARPTRTAVGVAALPFGLRVEITAVAHDSRP